MELDLDELELAAAERKDAIQPVYLPDQTEVWAGCGAEL